MGALTHSSPRAADLQDSSPNQKVSPLAHHRQFRSTLIRTAQILHTEFLEARVTDSLTTWRMDG